MTMCGLIQSIFVRVPVTEMRFVISKMADGEWCADRAAVNSNKAKDVIVGILPLKMRLLVGGMPRMVVSIFPGDPPCRLFPPESD